MSATDLRTVGIQQCVPLLAISSMEVSRRFYVEGLGARMTREWVHDGRLQWCWLQLGDAALMLQEVVPTERWTRDFAGRAGTGVSLNFTCADAIAYYRQLRERGKAVQRPFVGNGMWVTSIKDPDGYDLHFESPTDVPEGTEWTE